MIIIPIHEPLITKQYIHHKRTAFSLKIRTKYAISMPYHAYVRVKNNSYMLSREFGCVNGCNLLLLVLFFAKLQDFRMVITACV